MKEYMLSVFVCCAVFSFFSQLSYKSQLDGTRKFAFGIILAAVVASPALDFLGSAFKTDIAEIIPNIEELDSESEEIYEEAFCNGVADAVSQKFELKRSEVRVICEEFDREGWRCEKIKVILSGSAAFEDCRRIEDYINKMEIGECFSEIEIG